MQNFVKKEGRRGGEGRYGWYLGDSSLDIYSLPPLAAYLVGLGLEPK